MIIAGIFMALFGAFFFWRAVKSRKSYACTACDEKFTGEFIEASRCSVCGAPLKQIEGKQ
ncbi:MAG: hypothetical protein MJK04_35380 [Psychrosphaera sp.]|nr:hypothetical protein [Psychrosphaera sp.]